MGNPVSLPEPVTPTEAPEVYVPGTVVPGWLSIQSYTSADETCSGDPTVEQVPTDECFASFLASFQTKCVGDAANIVTFAFNLECKATLGSTSPITVSDQEVTECAIGKNGYKCLQEGGHLIETSERDDFLACLSACNDNWECDAVNFQESTSTCELVDECDNDGMTAEAGWKTAESDSTDTIILNSCSSGGDYHKGAMINIWSNSNTEKTTCGTQNDTKVSSSAVPFNLCYSNDDGDTLYAFTQDDKSYLNYYSNADCSGTPDKTVWLTTDCQETDDDSYSFNTEFLPTDKTSGVARSSVVVGVLVGFFVIVFG